MNFKINVTLESGTWIAETVGLLVSGDPLNAVGESDESLRQAIANLAADIQDRLLISAEEHLSAPVPTQSY